MAGLGGALSKLDEEMNLYHDSFCNDISHKTTESFYSLKHIEGFFSLCFLKRAVAVFLICLWLFKTPCSNTSLTSGRSLLTIQYEEDGGVILIGDSLIHVACHEFGMIERMRSLVTAKDFGYTNLGVNADTIEKIRARLHPILHAIARHKNSSPNASPTLAFLLWDSDVSETDFSALTVEEIAMKRHKFVEDVRFVTHALQLAGAKVLALSGPGMLDRYEGDYHRQVYLEDYRSILMQIAAESHVSYIDIRTPFLSSERNPTLDGEHPNALGAEIISQLFAKRLNEWILEMAES